MKTPTFVILAVLALACAGPALAIVNGPALLSDPAHPTGGRYLRTDDNRWVDWDQVYGLVVPGALAPVGTPFSTVTCGTAGAWCYNEQGTCAWADEATLGNAAPYRQPSSQHDFQGGRCIEARAKGDGSQAFFQFRPAARVAQVADVSGDPSASWTYEVQVRWHNDAGPLANQGPAENPINPSKLVVALSGCDVNFTAQPPALQGAHWFTDCVWDASAEIDMKMQVPVGITGGPITGFTVYPMLKQTGGAGAGSTWQAPIKCHRCFS